MVTPPPGYQHRALAPLPAQAALLRVVALSTSRNHGDRAYPAHHHGDHELVLVHASGYRCRIAGRALSLAAGDALLVVPGDEHADGGTAAAQWSTLRFRVWIAAPRRQELALLAPGTTAETRRIAGLGQELAPLVAALAALADTPDAGTALAADALATAIIWRVAARLPPAALHPRLAGILAGEDLLSRLARAVTAAGFARQPVAALARALGMSPSHLAHSCARACGQGPAEIALVLRLAEARRLLGGGAAVGEAGAATGFSEPAHFTRAYRRAYGRPPSADAGGQEKAGKGNHRTVQGNDRRQERG